MTLFPTVAAVAASCLLAELDDSTPASPCADVDVVVYPDAHHAFVSTKSVRIAPGSLNTSKCGVATVGRDGERYSQFGTTKNMSWRGIIRRAMKSGCITRGQTVGRNDAAAEDALKRTLGFVEKHLGNSDA